jgi:hypothetical protein
MKVWAIVLAVLAAVAIACETTLFAVIKVPFLLAMRLAGIVPQLSLAVLALVAGAVVVIAVAHFRNRGPMGSAAFLGLLSVLAPLVGITAALYQLMVFATIVAPRHPTTTTELGVMAPSLVDGGTPLAFSLLIAAIAAGAGEVGRARARAVR